MFQGTPRYCQVSETVEEYTRSNWYSNDKTSNPPLPFDNLLCCQRGQSLFDPERRRAGGRVLVPALGHELGERLQGPCALRPPRRHRRTDVLRRNRAHCFKTECVWIEEMVIYPLIYPKDNRATKKI